MLGFECRPGHDRIGSDGIEIQLDRVGAGVLEQLRIAQPPADVGAVQAGDHRDVEGRLRRFDEIEIPVDPAVVVVEFGPQRRRLAEAVPMQREEPVDLARLVLDLLFEERWQHDGGGAVLLEGAQPLDIAGQRPGGRNDRRTQWQAQVRGVQIRHRSMNLPLWSSWCSAATRPPLHCSA